MVERSVVPGAGTGLPGACGEELRYDLQWHPLCLRNLQVDEHPGDKASHGKHREYTSKANGGEKDREGVGDGHVPDPVSESTDCYAKPTYPCGEDLCAEDVRDYAKAHLEAAQVSQDAGRRDYRIQGRAYMDDAGHYQHQEGHHQNRERRQ